MKANVIYGRTFPPCQFCEAAKKLLELEKYDFEFVEIDDNIKEAIEMKENRMVTTVPQIYINDKYVGGYRELVTHIEDLKSIRGLEL